MLSEKNENLKAALDLALKQLFKLESGDSRAVSDAFVAMAKVLSDIETKETMDYIRRVREASVEDLHADTMKTVKVDAQQLATLQRENELCREHLQKMLLAQCGVPVNAIEFGQWVREAQDFLFSLESDSPEIEDPDTLLAL